jgi:glycosyltransferase involved in cell wall biosynthesis
VVRVLIDVSAVPDLLTGAGVYTTEITRALSRRDDVDIVLLARRGDRERWQAVAPGRIVHDVVPSVRPLRLAWEQAAGPGIATRLGIDVWHGPHYTMPRFAKVPAVVTVHDLTFYDHPDWHERAKVLYFRRAIAQTASRAAVIVCVSETTRDRLAHHTGRTHGVVVVHHGIDTDRFTPTADRATDQRALAALGLTRPYVAFVGTMEPRKNVPALVEAFARVAREHLDLTLVLAGRPGWGGDAIDAAVAAHGVADRVARVGYVPDGALPALLRGASAVAYPSFEEGFGIPPLEAMACGTPVLTTTAVATAELVGDAVATAAADPVSIAEGIRDVLDPATAARLRAAGPGAAARFSWAAAAERHVEAYRAARAGGPIVPVDPGDPGVPGR